MASSPLILLENLSVSYGHADALRDISGHFEQGSLTAIAGPNGAGKSTLLKTIAGIMRPSKGTIRFAPDFTGRIAYLPQTSTLDRAFPMNVWDVAALGLWPEIGDAHRAAPAMKTRVDQALADVDLSALAHRQISDLSGGQFQRLLFARLIVENAPIILLDEPFAAVDAETTARLIQILLSWHKEGRTVICVLHDLMLIHKYFPESFVLAGHCLGRGHTHQMFERNLLSFDLDMAEIRTADEAGDTPCACGKDHHA